MANKPKTAYDARRYLTLVQVLASDDYLEQLPALAQSWGVPLTATDYLHEDSMIHTIAKHVVAYHRQQDSAATDDTEAT